MSIMIVLENPKEWPLSLAGVEVVAARDYLVEDRFADRKGAKVFNLCKSYRYQSLGYYVSLLAAARGHKPLPAISTIQDLKLSEIVRIAGEEEEDLVEQALGSLKSGTFVLSIYFGRNMAKRYERLALAIFNQFPAPLLRAHFRHDGEKWILEALRPIAASEIPPQHHQFVIDCAQQYFTRPTRPPREREFRYDLAILYNPSDCKSASDEKAIKRFIKAGESMGIDVDLITRDDYGRIGEFDALFIRDTTNVNHYTFRFARRAAAEGLVVIDDPESILRCSNKVYLDELMQHHRLARPRTVIVHKGNWEGVPDQLGFPLVIKQPDSSFSLGVKKMSSRDEYAEGVDRMFETSDLLIAQEFVPTEFDWRIGMLDREPLYCCKYFMAESHWQIYDNSKTGDDALGNFETWPVQACPADVLKTAIRVANLIGDGLYGVDIKEVNGRALVVEVNDNPSLDSGIEDQVLGDELYLRIMRTFLKRLESRGR
jgi:glutathione synthase/RimK-type ligase-like ATP-grasp enzyme